MKKKTYRTPQTETLKMKYETTMLSGAGSDWNNSGNDE